MKSIKKIYSNLNFADPKTGEPNPMTIYVKNGFIEKVTDEKLDIGIDYIDCNNSFVLPGFTDGHGHMTHLGKTQYEVDLSNCKSESDVIFDIEKFHKENSNLDWIIGGGWNQENWDKKILPNNYKLSKKFPAIPVVMIRVDGHAMWANKKAIEIAGINGETINPEGGEILKENNEPTGILIDKAQSYMKDVMPKENLNDVKKWILEAQSICLSKGLTEVHDAGISSIQYKSYLSLIKEDKLKIRIYGMANQEFFEDGVGITSERLFELRSVKLVSDGALGSRGAALIEKYSDDDSNGILILDKLKMHDLFKKAFEQNFQVCIHAIGDHANKELLDSFESVLDMGIELNNHRTRIEHAQIIKKEDIKRISNLKIIASVQPVHCISDMFMAEFRLGDRIKDSYLWKTLLDNQIKIMGGSDFPVEDSSPLIGIHAAVNRNKINFVPENGWEAKEKLTVYESVKMFTEDTAFGSFKENLKGKIAVGYMADFTLLDRNIYKINTDEILASKIVGTIVDGEMVYKNF